MEGVPETLTAKTTKSFPALSPTGGRWCIVLAAVLWSTSGGLTKILTQDTVLGLNTPQLDPIQIAFFRVLFAGLVLLPGLRWREISFRPLMLLMVGCFALMNVSYIWAQAVGTAANAVFLQYTAPMWLYLASITWLGEPVDRRSTATLVLGLLGISVILWGGRQEAQLTTSLLALFSGITFAGVLLGLRLLRSASSPWLTVLNHLGGALALAPFLWYLAPSLPSLPQLLVLLLFGAVQLGLPYWLMAAGLRVVSPQEAGALTLLEPLLNPVWAYLASGERVPPFTLAGGAFILGGLLWRYWPRRG